MKRWIALAIFVIFAASAICVFADEGPRSKKTVPPGKKSAVKNPPASGIFQSTAEDVSEFVSWLKGEKSTHTKTPTGTFQEISDYINENVKASESMRASSLRGREDEIARRRGQ